LSGALGVIMAGGRGTRLRMRVEKPMLEFLGRPLIDYVIGAMARAERVAEIVVAVTAFTPETEAYVRRRGVLTARTPGRGFVWDLRFVASLLGARTLLICPCDLPLLNPEILNVVVDEFHSLGCEALTVVAPLDEVRALGLRPSYTLRVEGMDVVPCGIGVFDGPALASGRVLSERYFVTRDPGAIVNVNTVEDLAAALRLVGQRILRILS